VYEEGIVDDGVQRRSLLGIMGQNVLDEGLRFRRDAAIGGEFVLVIPNTSGTQVSKD
jgi:hypothetical protein